MIENFEKVNLEIHGLRLPQIDIPNDFEDTQAYLKKLSQDGLDKKGLTSQEYKDRMNYELSIIFELGFTDYILLVYDVIAFCKKNKIPVGKGRGSAAGSLILYSIGVTGIDPIKYGLIFERFISKVRAKSKVVDGIMYLDGSLAPDVDLDICTERRDEVIKYLENKYAGKFCKLPTISSLSTKQVIKDVGKIFGMHSEEDMNAITALIPTLYGKPFSIDQTREHSEKFDDFAKENPEVIKIAKKLTGLMRQKGSHASAYLVSFEKLDDFMPCEMDTHGELTASYDMNYAQEECIKLDLLGLHGVTLSDKVCQLIDLDLDNFDPEDPFIYDMLQHIELPYGLFQIGSDTNYRVTKSVKPKNFEELSAVVALARPGALDYVDDYCARDYQDKFGIPELRKILEKTHGVPLYQEQTMAIAHKVFGFSLDDAEILRRVIGKKKTKEMPAWRDRVYKAAEEKNYSIEVADFYWKLLEDSANYSFNLSHAMCYAYLAALTVYLKFKYPLEFYLECLKMTESKTKPQELIPPIEHEVRQFGIELLPPDFLHSKNSFAIEGQNIRFGFSAIKGVSSKSLPALEAFLSESKSNKFEVFNAANNAKLNIGIVCALIQAGMLSSCGENRERMVYEAQLWNLLTDREKAWCLKNGENYEFNLIHMVKNIDSWIGDNGKKVARSTRFNTIKKNQEKYKQIYLQNRKYPDFAAWFYEKTLLGYSYSTTLKTVFSKKRKTLYTIEEIKNTNERSMVEGVAEVIDKIKGVSKRGNKYLKIILSDETGAFDAMIVGDKMEQALREEPEPKVGDILFFTGQNGGEIVWLNKIKAQNKRIYMKLKDIK